MPLAVAVAFFWGLSTLVSRFPRCLGCPRYLGLPGLVMMVVAAFPPVGHRHSTASSRPARFGVLLPHLDRPEGLLGRSVGGLPLVSARDGDLLDAVTHPCSRLDAERLSKLDTLHASGRLAFGPHGPWASPLIGVICGTGHHSWGEGRRSAAIEIHNQGLHFVCRNRVRHPARGSGLAVVLVQSPVVVVVNQETHIASPSWNLQGLWPRV